MSSREFAEWMAYYNLEPWGGEYDAYERALIASMILNVNLDRKKRSNDIQPRELMVRFVNRERPQPADLLEKVRLINRMLGGKDFTRGDTE